MDMLNAMEMFVRIVDKGSLTAAASGLDTSVPSAVQNFELGLTACRVSPRT